MVFATIVGIVVLVLLVLPGLAFELIRQRRRAGRDDSLFIEASRVLVAGLASARSPRPCLPSSRLLGRAAS